MLGEHPCWMHCSMPGWDGWLYYAFHSCGPCRWDDADDDDEDYGNASSPSDNEMSAWHSYPLSLMTKNGSSFGCESSHT